MKIRQGFVSNSSSSSFVILFDHKPKDEADCFEQLFKTPVSETEKVHIHAECIDEVIHGLEAAGMVYEQTKVSIPDKETIECLTDLIIMNYHLSASYLNKDDDICFGFFDAYVNDFDKHLSENIKTKLIETATEGEKLRKIYYNLQKKCLQQLKNENKIKDNNKLWDASWKQPEVVAIREKEYESEEKFRNISIEAAKEFLATMRKRKKYSVVVSFSDDSSRDAVMEYGNAFNKIEHIKINQH